MGVLAKSSHGAKLEVQIAPGGSFARVSELGDIGDVGTDRPATDVSVHNEDIDTWILGTMTRPDMSFPINWVTQDATHQAILLAHYTNAVVGWRLTSADGDILIFSGGVKSAGQPHPVNGGLRRNITVRPSGLFKYNNTIVGVVA